MKSIHLRWVKAAAFKKVRRWVHFCPLSWFGSNFCPLHYLLRASDSLTVMAHSPLRMCEGWALQLIRRKQTYMALRSPCATWVCMIGTDGNSRPGCSSSLQTAFLIPHPQRTLPILRCHSLHTQSPRSTCFYCTTAAWLCQRQSIQTSKCYTKM